MGRVPGGSELVPDGGGVKGARTRPAVAGWQGRERLNGGHPVETGQGLGRVPQPCPGANSGGPEGWPPPSSNEAIREETQLRSTPARMHWAQRDTSRGTSFGHSRTRGQHPVPRHRIAAGTTDGRGRAELCGCEQLGGEGKRGWKAGGQPEPQGEGHRAEDGRLVSVPCFGSFI